MNKISLFTLLILIYLGLSKSFSHSERATAYIINERVFPSFFQDTQIKQIEVILEGQFKTGLLIKTYFLELKLMYAFKQPERIVVRTSRDFWMRNQKNIGMSIFRRYDRKESRDELLPLPPGSLFIGDPAFGTWEMRDSGIKRWKFHRAYKFFPQFLNWGKFRPSYGFYEKLIVYRNNDQVYYGQNDEFGTEGSISSEILKKEKPKNVIENKLKKHLRKLFSIPKV